jgi:hypothetical protein
MNPASGGFIRQQTLPLDALCLSNLSGNGRTLRLGNPYGLRRTRQGAIFSRATSVPASKNQLAHRNNSPKLRVREEAISDSLRDLSATPFSDRR